MYTCSTTTNTTPVSALLDDTWALEDVSDAVDGVRLFDTELYMFRLPAGAAKTKTSSFKRCLFLKLSGAAKIVACLATAARTCPLSLCYIHLLHGGGAVSDVAADATAFGCRDWDFACVISGVWRRDQDGTKAARSAV